MERRKTAIQLKKRVGNKIKIDRRKKGFNDKCYEKS